MLDSCSMVTVCDYDSECMAGSKLGGLSAYMMSRSRRRRRRRFFTCGTVVKVFVVLDTIICSGKTIIPAVQWVPVSRFVYGGVCVQQWSQHLLVLVTCTAACYTHRVNIR